MTRIRDLKKTLTLMALIWGGITPLPACAKDSPVAQVSAGAERRHVIEAPPTEVMRAILRSLNREQALDFSVMEHELEGADVPRVDGRPVSTLFETVEYPCTFNLDHVPREIWSRFCTSDKIVVLYEVSGTPGVEGGSRPGLWAAPDREFLEYSYYIDELPSAAESMDVPLEEVTSIYRDHWTEHLPFPYRQFVMEGSRLVIIRSESDWFARQPRPRVISLYVFELR
jgi:hypothetical protein